MPRTSSNTPERDDDGRFTNDDQGVQARGRDDNDDNRTSRSQSGGNQASGNQAGGNQAAGGQGRGWYGDSQGHAEAGSHSHDNSRSRSYDDDDRRGGNRGRDSEGRFAGASHDDEADYGAWHAYGHARGYHGYQRRGPQASGNRGQSTGDGRGWYGDSQGHAEAGSHSHDNGQSRGYADDDHRGGNYGGNGNRSRDSEGRFSGNRH